MADEKTSNSEALLEDFLESPYKYGFKTDIETENFPKGLNLDIVEKISEKKNEPAFLKKISKKCF